MTVIPSQLRESLQKGLAIPFIGAGVSMSVNNSDGKPLFPSWKTLLEQASERLEAEGKHDDASLVTILVKQIRFLEAAKEAKRALGANWFSFLKQQLDPHSNDAEPDSLELARRVWKLGSNLIITTNYDNVLRWACPQSRDLVQWDIEAPVEQCEMLRSGMSKPTVWHLHGKIDNAAEIILTPDGYQKLYSENNSSQKYKAALQTLRTQLSSRTFIFIGFSLADEDFVQQIELVAEIFQGATGPHYVLLPESQKATFKSPVACVEAVYFSDFGAPQLELMNELASIATTTVTPTIATSNYEVGDYSPDKSVFFVPFPSKGEHMIGRQEVLQRVHQQLCTGKRTSIGQTASFQGLGGLGKTQLAVEYAYTYQNEYTNGVIWINADQDISAQLTQLAEKARWVSPLSEQAFKLTTATKRLREVPSCLIIFDNLENLKDIEEILPTTHTGSHILVTSRRDQPGFTPIFLNTLTPDQGLQLLLQEAERQPQNKDENQAASAIVQQLDGLPLALELAGAYLRRRASVGWRQYLELLQDNLSAAFPSFLQKESWTRHEADIYSTLKIHEVLFEEEPLLREILDVLTWSGPASMSVSLLCALLAQNKASNLTGALSLGCALRILQQSNDRKAYSIHRLVREVRRAELPLAQKTDWAETCIQRMSNWFEKHRHDFLDLPLFEANLDHLQAWQQNAQVLNLPLQAAHLMWLQAYPAWHWGRYREAKQNLDQAQTLYGHSSTQNGILKAHLLNDLGSVTNKLGDRKTALELGEEALSLRHRLFGETHADIALSLNNVASCYGSLGDISHALELGTQALQIQRKLFGDENRYTAISLANIAGYYDLLDNIPLALELGEQALCIRRKLFGDEHPDTAVSLGNLAVYYSSLGNSHLALELSEQALRIQRKLFGEEHPDTAQSLNNIATFYSSLGNIPLALELGEQALCIRRKLFGDEHPHTAQSLNNVASYYSHLGNIKHALELGEAAWLIRQKLLSDEHPETVVSNYNLICYLRDANKGLEAFRRLQHQLSLLRRDHPYYKKLIQLSNQLSSKTLRNGFRQPSKKSGKNKSKRHR